MEMQSSSCLSNQVVIRTLRLLSLGIQLQEANESYAQIPKVHSLGDVGLLSVKRPELFLKYLQLFLKSADPSRRDMEIFYAGSKRC